MYRKRNLLITSVCALALLSMATSGSGSGPSGRTLGVTCNGCHGTDGHSKGAVPSLAGLPAGQIAQSLRDFKSGKRPSTIMGRLARGYDDEEITAVSEYFAHIE